MKKFYVVSAKDSSSAGVIVELLRVACESRAIPFISLHPETVDWTDLPQLEAGDMLYRTEDNHFGGVRQLAWALIQKNTATFFSDYDQSFASYEDYMILQKKNISTPPTIPYLSPNRTILEKSVDTLGGFPIIIKALGGSHGVGVMKIDSLSSLFSVCDFIRKHSKEIILRKFIPSTYSARLIVLGDSVIDSIQYNAPKGDFRSNEGATPNVAPMKFSSEVEATAVAAVKALNLEFGGVDIMVEESSNQHFVTEVNFPCYFARCQNLTGTDISGQMVEYLLAKGKSHG
jgi:hypothetical protein